MNCFSKLIIKVLLMPLVCSDVNMTQNWPVKFSLFNNEGSGIAIKKVKAKLFMRTIVTVISM